MINYVTGEDIEALAKSGNSRLVLGPNDRLTGIARENCERYGISIVAPGSDTSAASPRSGAGSHASPAASFVPESFRPSSAPARVPRAGSGGSGPEGYDIEAWRAEFPILKEAVHLANCSQSPQCDRTRAAAEAYLDSWGHMGMDWDRWVQEVNLAKAEFARIINADPEEVAVGTSVSEITSTIASAARNRSSSPAMSSPWTQRPAWSKSQQR